MSRNGFVFRLIGVILLIALIAVAGVMVYRAGQAQGIAQAPAVATAIAKAAENGAGAPVPPMYGYGNGYGYRYGHHPMMWGSHFGFMPFGFMPFGFCGSILFLLLFLGILKMLFFRPWRWGWGHHGPWEEGSYPRHWGPPWMRREEGENDKKDSTSEEKK